MAFAVKTCLLSYLENITPSHHRICQHHLVTHHLIHLPQQPPKNPKRSLENNHWLHPRHQNSTPLLRDQNPPTPKPSQTSRITTHTKSLPPHSSSTPTHHTRSPRQIQKTIHIQQQHQLHSKHTFLPDHLSHTNMKTIHTKIVHDYISSTHNKILSKQPPPIHEAETILDHHTRRTLAQFRSNKSPFILSYLNKISLSSHSSPLCLLCQTHLHDTLHLFTCPKISTTLGPDPVRAAKFLDHWTVLMGT